MNHIYRLVWNRAKRVMQVASELAVGKGGASGPVIERHSAPSALAVGVAMALAGMSGSALAGKDFTIAPSGGDLTGTDIAAILASSDVDVWSSSGITPGSGDIHVNDAVNWSVNTLTLTAARDVNINAALSGSGTSKLIVNSATGNGADAAVSGGSIHLGSNVTTGMGQTYNGAVLLDADVALTNTGSGSIVFGSTVDGAHALSVNNVMDSVFNAVGSTMALSSLTTDAGGSTTLNGDVTTIGVQSYGDAVHLGADVTLSSTVGGDIGFNSTLDGAHALTVNTSGSSIFNAVGSTMALSSLATDAGGITRLNGNVTTIGAQSYGDAVMLGANVTLSSTGSGNIVFNSTVDGARALTVNTSGAVNFTGAVGGTTPLTELDVNSGTFSANALNIGNGGLSVVTTNGAITQGGAFQVAGASSFDAGVGNIVLANAGNWFDGVVNARGNNVTIANSSGLALGTVVATGSVNLASSGAISQAVGGGVHAATLSGNSSGSTRLLGANVVGTLDGFTSGGDFALNSAGTLMVSGAVTANGVAGNLTLRTTGASSDLIVASDLTGSTMTLDAGRNLSQIAGMITTGTLSGSVGGSATLGGLNSIAQLGNFSANGLRLVNLGSLTMIGAVNGGTGTTALTTIGGASLDINAGASVAGTGVTLNGGDFILSGAVNAGNGTATLTSSAAIDQATGSGVITAGTLTGSALGNVSLLGENHVGTLGSFSSGGDFAFNNAQTLTVDTAPLANGGFGNLTLGTTGANSDLILTSDLQGNTVTLGAGRDIDGGAGTITANTLTGTVNGMARLGGLNDIVNLGNFSADDGLNLQNRRALDVTGTVDGGMGLTDIVTAGHLSIGAGARVTSGFLDLLTHGGDLSVAATGSVESRFGHLSLNASRLVLDGAVNAGNSIARLIANDTISQAAGSGVITADMLTGSSTHDTTLGGANLIASLGDFNATNFSLTNARALTIAGTLAASGDIRLHDDFGIIVTGAVIAGGSTTLDAGTTLQVGDGGSAGSISGDVVADGRLAFDRSSDLVFAGAISGSGAVVQQGNGRLVLDGNSGVFVGSTDVQSGSVIVGSVAGNGAVLGGDVDVVSGATLGGHGSIGGDVVNAGTLAPGASIGTLTIHGDYAQTATGRLVIEANADGQSDRLVVDGAATLAGSTLVLAQDGDWMPRTDYTILSADGGVSGQFGSTTSSLLFLDPVLGYGANAVTLSLQRNNTGFVSVAGTRNQHATAVAADMLGWDNAAYVALTTLDADNAPQAFDALSGEVHASARSALLDDSRHLREAINQHLQVADHGSTGGWAASWGHWARNDSDGNADALRGNGLGFAVGADFALGEQARVGAVIGSGQLTARADARASLVDIDSRHLGLYGSTRIGGLLLQGGAARSLQQAGSQRTVVFGAYNDTLQADYDARTTQLYLDGSHAFAFSRGSLVPFLNLAQVKVRGDAFDETGGDAALHVDAASNERTYATVGARWTAAFGEQDAVHWQGSAGWMRAFGGDDLPLNDARFLTGSDTFTIAGAAIADNAFAFDAGLRWQADPHLVIDASYVGRFASGARDQGARLTLNLAF